MDNASSVILQCEPVPAAGQPRCSGHGSETVCLLRWVTWSSGHASRSRWRESESACLVESAEHMPTPLTLSSHSHPTPAQPANTVIEQVSVDNVRHQWRESLRRWWKCGSGSATWLATA